MVVSRSFYSSICYLFLKNLMEDIVGYLKADIFLIHETEGVLRGKWLKSKMPSTDSFEKKLRMETQTCIDELKLLRTWKETKRAECVFQITKLSGWHMVILSILSMYHPLLPGETGILLAISHKTIHSDTMYHQKIQFYIIWGQLRIP